MAAERLIPIPLGTRGIQKPAGGTPSAAPGTLRRTTSIVSSSPQGLSGPLLFDLRGRDLLVDHDGRPRVASSVQMLLSVRRADRVIEWTESVPDELGDLVNLSIKLKFRAEIARRAVDDSSRTGLAFAMLNDLPTVSMISEYPALIRGQPVTIGDPVGRMSYMADVCSGWAASGSAATTVLKERAELVINGPLAQSLDNATQPWAWHELPPLVPESMRRLRRIDLLPGSKRSAPRQVASFFRDSAVLQDGKHTVIHEYGVSAVVDGECSHLLRTAVEPHVLPFRDCTRAAGSPTTLDGADLASLRENARTSLRGPGTCTHLTDTVGVLADVRALRALEVAVLQGHRPLLYNPI